MSLANFDPNKADNLEDVEKEFAVKAVEQMITYWKLLGAIKGSKLKLTPYDNEIFTEFQKDFPEYNGKEGLEHISEDQMKSKENKARWRDFFKKFDKKIEDYNFGTLLRVNSNDEYSKDNSIFVVRLQFYAFEIARNRLGLNDWVSEAK